MRRFATVSLCAVSSVLIRAGSQQQPTIPPFKEVSEARGLSVEHRYLEETNVNEPLRIAAGVAAGDYDGDGRVDLFIATGDASADRMCRNTESGDFDEATEGMGVSSTGRTAGPAFADLDGDGRIDLFVGGAIGTKPKLFRNMGDGHFEDWTAQSHLDANGNTFSAAFGDYDRDGDLDIVMGHWMGKMDAPTDTVHLWRNRGNAVFDAIPDLEAGLDGLQVKDFTFTPNFADLNSDGWPDLLFSADFNTSQVYLNQGDGTFENITDEEVITDENGMGGAVADYDNDGDLDWFVSSIWDPTQVPSLGWGITGNRLYRNRGAELSKTLPTQPACGTATGVGAAASPISTTMATPTFSTSTASTSCPRRRAAPSRTPSSTIPPACFSPTETGRSWSAPKRRASSIQGRDEAWSASISTATAMSTSSFPTTAERHVFTATTRLTTPSSTFVFSPPAGPLWAPE